MNEPRHASGKQRGKDLWRYAAAQRRAWSVGQVGRRIEVHAEADHNAVAAPFEQDPGKLLAVKKQVVRPFEHQRLPGDGDVDGFDQRQAGRQRQRLWLRVAWLELDDRASVEIAERRKPFASLPPPARLLLERDKPVALTGCLIGDKVSVGRAGALDETDASQKSVPAARSVSVPRGPISK